MVRHTTIQAGAGIGLMAASLVSAADLHTFGEAMSYYRVDGAATRYVHFLPSGATASDHVILLDMLQSGTLSTWAYAMGGALGAPAATLNSTNLTGFSNAAGGVAWKAFNVTYMAPGNGITSTASSTFYGGDAQQLSLSFAQTVTLSSQICNLSFSALLGTDDYLLFTNVTARPAGWPTATDSVTYRTKSGTTAGDTLSMGSDEFNGMNASISWSLPVFSAYSIPVADRASNTVAVSLLSAPFNKCAAAYAARTATNSVGGVVGGKAGLMRLW